MNDQQKSTLLKIARDTVEAVVKKMPLPTAQSDDLELNALCGCFVTLKTDDRLRGCIGQFTSNTPLIELIADMAKASAADDPRFPDDRVLPDELNKLDIEISVLSPLELTDDPLSLELGVHGIYIKKGYAAGCFLPQVATETGWTKEQFLSYCCQHKAMIDPNAWKNKNTQVYLFTAEVFNAPFNDI